MAHAAVAQDVWKTGRFDGAGSCMGCHTQPTAQRLESLDFVLLTEYATWKTQDKHALAFLALKNDRSKRIGRILKCDDVSKDEKAGCLNCHAMNFPKERLSTDFLIEDGVSCGGCHGPSEQWLGPHAKQDWRKKTPDEKYALGMHNLRDPIQRAELCASCHVGNAAEGKVVTHVMYAAGHPPLPPIEIATFSKNEPQHWRDAKDVPYFQKDAAAREKYFGTREIDGLQSKYALIGCAVVLRDFMHLVADRAKPQGPVPSLRNWPELRLSESGKVASNVETSLSAPPAPRWPEIATAQLDCFSCHHDLRLPSWRQQNGYGYFIDGRRSISVAAGRPRVRLWPLASAEVEARHAYSDDQPLDDLGKQLQLLARSSDAEPFADPQKLATAGRGISEWCANVSKGLMTKGYDSKSLQSSMTNVCKSAAANLDDYESARQLASLLQVMASESKQQGNESEIRAILGQMSSELNLQPYSQRPERQKLVMKVIAGFIDGDQSKGMSEFLEALKHPNDLEMQRRLVKNGYLRAIQSEVDNRKLGDKLGEESTLKELQKLSDSELAEALQKVNDYDPSKFKSQLQRLSELLSQK
jgi:hypothetical protein